MRTHKFSRVDHRLCKGGGKSGKGGGGGGGGSSESEPEASSGPKLPEGVTKGESDDGEFYTFKVGGNEVELTVNSSISSALAGQDGATIAFKVNGGFDRKNEMSQRESDAIALKVMRVMRYDASTRPDGFRYDTTAYTTDGFGGRRAQAYERLGGFSRPVGNNAGANQYGVVRNGKVVPDTERLAKEERRLRRAFGSRAFTSPAFS